MTHKHGGNIYEHKNAADFSANINFRGMPDSVRRAAFEAVDASIHYPEPGSRELCQILAKREKVSENQVICGNGAAELMFLLAMALRPKHAVLAQPCFFEYEQSLQTVDCRITNIWLQEGNGFELTENFVSQIPADADLVVLGNPNNPTGRLIPEAVLAKIRAHCHENGIWLVMDESFFDFLTEEDNARTAEAVRFEEKTVFVIKSFTKMYAMPGLRVGYGVCKNEALLEKMRLLMQPWNVSLPAQMAARAAAGEVEFAAETAKMTAVNRSWMAEKLKSCGYTVFPSCTNYLLFSGPAGLVEYAEAQGYLIRDCSNFRGLETEENTDDADTGQEDRVYSRQYYRICIRSRQENEALLAVLAAFQKKGVFGMAKAIMIQGTMSNAGKSVIAAGLCRIFHQDGYRTAPFKSQNMALNSFITKEGLEMGRAQVMQAEAAGIEPSVEMNPILLKPTNDIGSQVIVNGEVLGTMNARDYFKMKKSLLPDVKKAYDHLAEQYDIIVIEGAGSPAEINLKEDDIVNMGMAKLVDAPVLLVGDIDRGGVFAQLYGTVELLEPEEKARIKGLIINKFRGDKTILDPGVAMLEDLTGIPVVGVAPYLQVSLEDEDSLSERLDGDRQVGLIDIAVIRVPRISNFTDFNVFESIEGVTVRYVKEPGELGHPDLIILPGTKNTMRDLLWMRQNGLEALILKAQKAGTAIFGVCGGYQMLGKSIADPDGVEEGGTIRGMGLLDTQTVFEAEKARTRVEGRILGKGEDSERDCGGEDLFLAQSLGGSHLVGYEIHMGRTTYGPEAQPFTEIEDTITGKRWQEGAWSKNVCGTYVHGIFDSEEVVTAVVQALAEKKGVADQLGSAVDFAAFKEQQYDLLAEGLRKHLDMERIYQIMGIR